MKTLHIEPDNDGVRVDRVLRKQLAHSPLSAIYRFIRKGNIKVNGRRIKQNYRLKAGDTIEINASEACLISDKRSYSEKVASLIHTDFFSRNFRIIYEDESLIVCNKPAGLVVHSGTGHLKHDTLIDLAVSYVMHSSGKGNFTEPILVHRLDRDTSGVILIAKNKQLLRSLHSSIRSKEIKKRYVALCHGAPSVKIGTVDLSLVKTHERNRGMKVKVSNHGMRSFSSFRVVADRKNVSRIEIDLHTGRTHQIRVHMAHLSCPIIGDVRYGNHEHDRLFFAQHDITRRLYLHAEQISFFHPGLNRNVTFTAPVPEDFLILQ